MATRLTERVVRHMRAAIEERLLDCLGPEERAVVEGDFAELHVATKDALPELFGLHPPTPSWRVTKRVLMESLWAARRRASRASASGTPSIS